MGDGAPPAPTELLPGWRSANSTGPETKSAPSSHYQRERTECKKQEREGRLKDTAIWRDRQEKQEEREENRGMRSGNQKREEEVKNLMI